jgi:dTDP-4-dehydrorhamnose reductase
MKILVFGGSGRLGTAMDLLWRDTHELITPGREVDLLSIKAIRTCLEQHAPQLIINTVAYNDVDKAETDQESPCFQLNVQAATCVARAAASLKIPLIHFSTDYVFEGTKSNGYTENDAPQPQSIYGITKYLGEQGVRTTHPQSYIVRTSRLYGPKARSENAKKSFVDLILRDAEQSAHFSVNGAERAAPTYVHDLVRHVEQHLFSFPEPGIYHMANQGDATWFEWAKEIIRLRELPVTIEARDPATLQRPAARPAHSTLVSTKLPTMRSWQSALESFFTDYPSTFSPVWRP